MAEPDDFGAGVPFVFERQWHEALLGSWVDEEPERRHTVPGDAVPADDPETIAHLLAEDARLRELIASLQKERDEVKSALNAMVRQTDVFRLPDNRVVRWVEVERKGYTVAPSKFWTLKVGYE